MKIATAQVKIKKLRPDAKVPTYGSACAAGADLYAALDEAVTIEPGQTKFIATGVALAIPEGLAGFVYARSGLSCKQGLAPANKVGVVDADYRGEVMVALHNHDTQARTVQNGDRVAQIVFAPYVQGIFNEVDELDATERGTGGFGHTGK